MNILLQTFVVALAVCFAAVPICMRIARRYGIVALPSDDRPHSQPTPLLGGTAIMAGVMIAAVLAGGRDSFLIFGGLAMFAVGLVDDIVTLKPRSKLLLELVVLSLFVVDGHAPGILPWPAVEKILVVIWLLGAANAFNLVDGLDGLAAGIGLISSLAIAAISIIHHADDPSAIWAMAVAGSLCGFLLYNFNPASIFMGDEGALTLGMFLGVLSLQASRIGVDSQFERLAVAVLLLVVPILDVSIVMFTRFTSGRRIWVRGLDHSHHRLVKLGLRPLRVTMVMCVLAAINGVWVVAMTMMPSHYALMTLPFGVLFFALLGVFLIDLSFGSDPPGVMYGRLSVLPRMLLSFGYKRRIAEILLDGLMIAASYYSAYLIRTDFKIAPEFFLSLTRFLPLAIAITVLTFVLSGVYRSIWSLVNVEDLARMAISAQLAAAATFIASRAVGTAISGSIPLLYAMLLFNGLLASRVSFRMFSRAATQLAHKANRAIIVGATEAGEIAIRNFESHPASARLVGFVDDDEFKRGKVLRGYPILGTIAELRRIHRDLAFNEMIVVVDGISEERMGTLQSFAADNSVTLRRFSAGIITGAVETSAAEEDIAAVPAADPQVAD